MSKCKVAQNHWAIEDAIRQVAEIHRKMAELAQARERAEDMIAGVMFVEGFTEYQGEHGVARIDSTEFVTVAPYGVQ